MAYALIGIPLGLVMFQSIGERLNTFVRIALGFGKKIFKAKNKEVTQTHLVMVVTALSSILMTSMAAVFAKYERWEYFDALYYCFITLTTIGFGDYVALQKESALQSKPEYVVLSLIFILFGLSVVSSAVNLLVLKFLTLNTEDERRDEQLRYTASLNTIQLDGDVITPGIAAAAANQKHQNELEQQQQLMIFRSRDQAQRRHGQNGYEQQQNLYVHKHQKLGAANPNVQAPLRQHSPSFDQNSEGTITWIGDPNIVQNKLAMHNQHHDHQLTILTDIDDSDGEICTCDHEKLLETMAPHEEHSAPASISSECRLRRRSITREVPDKSPISLWSPGFDSNNNNNYNNREIYASEETNLSVIHHATIEDAFNASGCQQHHHHRLDSSLESPSDQSTSMQIANGQGRHFYGSHFHGKHEPYSGRITRHIETHPLDYGEAARCVPPPLSLSSPENSRWTSNNDNDVQTERDGQDCDDHQEVGCVNHRCHNHRTTPSHNRPLAPPFGLLGHGCSLHSQMNVRQQEQHNNNNNHHHQHHYHMQHCHHSLHHNHHQDHYFNHGHAHHHHHHHHHHSSHDDHGHHNHHRHHRHHHQHKVSETSNHHHHRNQYHRDDRKRQPESVGHKHGHADDRQPSLKQFQNVAVARLPLPMSSNYPGIPDMPTVMHRAGRDNLLANECDPNWKSRQQNDKGSLMYADDASDMIEHNVVDTREPKRNNQFSINNNNNNCNSNTNNVKTSDSGAGQLDEDGYADQQASYVTSLTMPSEDVDDVDNSNSNDNTNTYTNIDNGNDDGDDDNVDGSFCAAAGRDATEHINPSRNTKQPLESSAVANLHQQQQQDDVCDVRDDIDRNYSSRVTQHDRTGGVAADFARCNEGNSQAYQVDQNDNDESSKFVLNLEEHQKQQEHSFARPGPRPYAVQDENLSTNQSSQQNSAQPYE